MVHLFVVVMGLLQMSLGLHWFAFATLAIMLISDGIKEINQP